MDNFRRNLFEKAGYTCFSISLDRRYSECVSPSGLTYYVRFADLACTKMVEGYKYNDEVVIEQPCEKDTTILKQKILSRKALQRIPKCQTTFLDGYSLDIVVHEVPCTLPNGKRKPRKR